MFKAIFNKLFGSTDTNKKITKIKSIRKTFDDIVMRELTNRMVVHDDRVYEVSDLEWIHGMVQLLLEEEVSKRMLNEARTLAKSANERCPPSPVNEEKQLALGKKTRVYH